MDLFTAIKKRHSTRKYTDKDVDMHDLAVLLEAARHAPSSGNLQPWRFIVVKDKHKREALAQACQKQYWMAKAPIHIVVCAETEKVVQLYGIRGDRLYAVQNCAAAIENMLLSATALGLSSCWVGYFDEEEMRDLLGIPKRARPQAIITIGYEEYEETVEKVPLYNNVFFEGYGRRIENISKDLFGDWSDVWQQHINKAKEKAEKQKPKIQEHIKKLHGKIKEHIDALKEKTKKK